MTRLDSRIEALERTAPPSRDDSAAEAERLRRLLTARLAGIADRRKLADGYKPKRLTPEQAKALRAELNARLQACCPGY